MRRIRRLRPGDLQAVVQRRRAEAGGGVRDDIAPHRADIADGRGQSDRVLRLDRDVDRIRAPVARRGDRAERVRAIRGAHYLPRARARDRRLESGDRRVVVHAWRPRETELAVADPRELQIADRGRLVLDRYGHGPPHVARRIVGRVRDFVLKCRVGRLGRVRHRDLEDAVVRARRHVHTGRQVGRVESLHGDHAQRGVRERVRRGVVGQHVDRRRLTARSDCGIRLGDRQRTCRRYDADLDPPCLTRVHRVPHTDVDAQLGPLRCVLVDGHGELLPRKAQRDTARPRVLDRVGQLALVLGVRVARQLHQIERLALAGLEIEQGTVEHRRLVGPGRHGDGNDQGRHVCTRRRRARTVCHLE